MTGAQGLAGGIATANKNALRAVADVVAEQGWRLSVLSLHEQPQDRLASLPANVEFIAFRGHKLAFAGALMLRSLGRTAFVFDHATLALPVLPSTLLGRCQAIIFAHGSEADTRMRRTSQWMFRLATKVLTNSQLTMRRLLQRVPDARAEVCLLGLAPDFENHASHSAAMADELRLTACDGQSRVIGPHALLLVARIDASEGKKGHATVLQVLPELRRRFPDVQAIFPGSGSGREGLMRQAAERHIADAVFFPGHVEPSLLSQLYERCAAFVMPSQQEGFGLVYLEAMNSAKPCIGCRNDGAEEVIVHEQTGLLIQRPHDPTELAAAVERLLADPAWAESLGIRGRERLQTTFTAEQHQSRVRAAVRAALLA